MGVVTTGRAYEAAGITPDELMLQRRIATYHDRHGMSGR